MKIKEKTKRFVKEHKKEIVTVGTIIGGVTIFSLGQAVGASRLLDAITKDLGIDLRKDTLQTEMKVGTTVKDMLRDGVLPDVFKQANLNSLDDKIKGVMIIQKK